MHLVYYAIDDGPKYRFLARRSLASLRASGCQLPVVAVVSGSDPTATRAALEPLGAIIVPRPPVEPLRRTFLKWYALSAPELADRHLLFADADTDFGAPAETLFTRHHGRDLVARREAATGPGGSLDLDALADLRTDLGLAPCPVFNTGVMLLSPALRQRLVTILPLFDRLFVMFATKVRPFPGRNWHILEEVVASLVLGSLDHLDWAELAADEAPFFFEVEQRMVPGPGVILHVWSGAYARFLAWRGDSDALDEFTRLQDVP